MVFPSRPPRWRAVFRAAEACLVAFILALSATNAEEAPQGGALRPIRLQLRWEHQFQFAGYYVAIEKGYYRELGLEVTAQEIVRGTDPNQTVLSGGADFGVGSSTLLLLKSKGAPIVALAPVMQHSPIALVALRKSGIDTVHDLAGKRILMEPDSGEILAYLKHEGVPLDSISHVTDGYSVDRLIRGEVDALSVYVTDEPYLLAERKIPFVMLSPLAGGIDFYGDILFTTQGLMNKEPKLVNDFVRASMRGWRYAMAHTEETVDLIFEKYSQKHTKEHLRFEASVMRRLVMADVVEPGYTNPGRWRHIADTYAELGMMPQQFPLKDFLPPPTGQRLPSWLYASLALSCGALALVSWIAYRFYRMGRTIRRQNDELHASRAKIVAAELRYRSLAEKAPFGVMITKPEDGTIVYANPYAAKLLGLPLEKAVGCQFTRFYADLAVRKEILSLLSIDGTVPNRDVLLKTHEGPSRWVTLAATLIHYEGNNAIFVSFIDASRRKKAEEEREQLITELQDALASVKTLHGMLPICASCKKIRDDKGYWNQVEHYIAQHSEAEFTHGICPECMHRMYPDINL